MRAKVARHFFVCIVDDRQQKKHTLGCCIFFFQWGTTHWRGDSATLQRRSFIRRGEYMHLQLNLMPGAISRVKFSA
jgi:hypothetical protein